jgi:serine protease Do
LVAGVLENSPAQKAGIKESDIIKQFDQQAVNNIRELLAIVAKTEVGRKARVVLVRDKKEFTVEVQIGQRPENLEEEKEEISEAASSKNWRGIEADQINPQVARRFRIEEKKGVVVVHIDPGSPADEAGIIPGDVILEINKKALRDLADYQKITEGLKTEALVRTARGYFLVKESE